MASAEYLFRVSMDASGAMASAKAFSQQLQKELGNIKLKGVDVGVADRQFANIRKAAAQTGGDAGALMGKQMEASIQRFQTTAARAGMTLGDPLMQSLERTMRQPSLGAISAVDTLEKRLKSFDAEVGRMGFTAGGWQQAGWMEQRAGALQAAQRQWWGVRGMGAQMQMYGREMMMGGAAVLGGAGAAANEYAKFAEPLGRAARNLELNTQLTQELDASLRSLAGTASVFTPEEQAAGLYQWAAATGEVVESSSEMDALLGRVAEVQKLSSLGMVDYGTAVEAVTDVQSQFQLGIGDTERIVATLVKVAATSKAEVGDLAEAFRYAGTYAHQTNTTFSETAGIFQLLSAYGQRGSMAGRGMARLMEGLIAPSKQAKAAMDELFKDAFGRTDVLKDAQGQFIGMARTIEVLAQATENLTQAERAEFVAKITTQNAARILLPLLSAEIEARKRGISAVQENIKIIDGQADAHTDAYVNMMQDVYGYTVATKSAAQTLEDQWSQFLESTDGKVKMAKAGMQSAIVTIGASVMQVALPAMEKLAEVMQGIAAYAETHPGAVNAVLGGATIAIAVGALVTALGKGVTLYADVKAIAAALTFKAGVDMFSVDVAAFVAATRMMGAQQGAGMIGGLAGGAGGVGRNAITGLGVAGGAGGVAAGAGGIGLLGFAGIAAGVVAATAAAIELGNQLTLGRSTLDLMNTESEALAAGMAAAADAAERLAEVSPDERKATAEGMIGASEAELARYEKWLNAAASIDYGGVFGKGQIIETREELEEYQRIIASIPDKFRTSTGKVSVALLEEAVAMSRAELEQYQEALDRIVEAERKVEAARADSVMLMQVQRYQAQQVAAATAAIPDEFMVPAIEDPSAMMSRFAGPAQTLEARGIAMEWEKSVESIKLDILYEMADVLGIDAEAIDTFINSLAGMSGIVANATGSLENAVAMLREFGRQAMGQQDLLGMLGSGAQGAWGSLKGLQGIGWGDEQIIGAYDEYLTMMEQVYKEAENMGRLEAELYIQAHQDAWDQTVQGHKDSWDQMNKDAEQAMKDRQRMLEQAEQGLRGIIEGQLSPTKVTAEDVAATDAGYYKDKWDEEVRRMKAAMAGSAEWKNMIPETVWAQGPEAAQAWGQNWINQFYAGMHPEAIRWDTLLDSIENALAMEAGKRNLVETVMQKLAEERGITATSEQVLAALGLTGMLPAGMLGPGLADGMAEATPEAMADQAATMAQNIIGPMNEQLGQMDLTDSAGAMLTSLNKAVKEKASAIPWSQQFHDAVKADVKKNETKLVGAGKMIGDALWSGIYKAFEDANIVWVIAMKVISIMNNAKEDSKVEGDT